MIKSKPKLNPFYKDLEAPILPLVKLLRDNGYNTTCSCGHGMWVELDIYMDMNDLEPLRSFLIDHGYKDFTITASIRVQSLWPTRRATVHIGNYVPCDVTSSKELTNKIADFKERCEMFNQENYQLRTRLATAEENVKRLSEEPAF